MQLQVERDVIRGYIGGWRAPRGPAPLTGGIVLQAQGEDSVQGGNTPSARQEGKEVAVAVQSQRGGSGPTCCHGVQELLLEDVQVSVEPVLCE